MTKSKVFESERCLVVAEVAQAHDGSLGTAHAYVDVAAESGADAVKFQVHIAEAESSPAEPWRVEFSVQDESRYAYWKRMEFTEMQWAGLRQHAASAGLLFVCSPFSVEATELMNRVGVDMWKVASGQVRDLAMIDAVAKTGKPVLVSSGMSNLKETDDIVLRLQNEGLDVTLLQCTSMYPTPADSVGLNMIGTYRQRYGCRIGLSDHSGTIFAGLAAATLGIDVLEVHVALSRKGFGPDIPVSLTPDELAQLVQGVKFIETANASPVDKDALAQDLRQTRELFSKSVFLAEDLPAGTVLSRQHLCVKKPGSGIPAHELERLIGRTLARDVGANVLLRESDLD